MTDIYDLIGPDELEKIEYLQNNPGYLDEDGNPKAVSVATSKHARLSPSSAHRWMKCPASLREELSFPYSSSEFADEGTAAHELASMTLESGADTSAYMGRIIQVGERSFEVDDDMATYVQTYVDCVRSFAEGNELMIEQRVDFSTVVNVPNSFGTADAIVITSDGREIQVHDLKYGRGVPVSAERNEQLMLYALGALNDFGMVGCFEHVRMVIHQPRLNSVSEWDCTVEELYQFAGKAQEAAGHAMHLIETNSVEEGDYNPGEKQCQWCKAKATCQALTNQVLTIVADDFVDISRDIKPQLEGCEAHVKASDNAHVANCLQAVDLIESWCKAVRAKAEGELFAGREVPGFKLVEGRKGHRKWIDEAEVEKTLKSMRLKTEQMYDLKLISPTTAEKLAKAGTIGVKQWPRLEKLYKQDRGSPSVAPVSDKRPALVVAAVEDDFDDETAGGLV